MKKFILIGSILILCLTGCNNERLAISNDDESTNNVSKLSHPIDVENFGNALRTMLKPENRDTADEIASKGNSMELSERRKDLILPSAVKLIKSKGYSDKDITKITLDDKGKIINFAMKIYKESLNKNQ